MNKLFYHSINNSINKSIFIMLFVFFVILISSFFASAGIVINKVSLVEPDIFYSNYAGNNVINIIVNATNATSVINSTYGVYVYANFSTINPGIQCNDTPGSNLIYLTGNVANTLWTGSCNVSSVAAVSNFNVVGAITVVAVNLTPTIPQVAVDTNTNIILYNMTTPPQVSSCERMGSSTTDFSQVTNFNSINFVVEIESNGSSVCHPGVPVDLPWGATFNKVLKMNFTSLNFTNNATFMNLQNLMNAINVFIIPPGSYGQSYISINSSAFAVLNTTSTITLYGLPFGLLPAIITPVGNNATNSQITLNSPYIISYGGYNQTVPNATLTFNVNAFSQYNISDNVTPIINVNSPLAIGYGVNSVIINVTVNGTGSQVNNISIFLNGAYNKSFAFSSNMFAECTGITSGWDVVMCPYTLNLLNGNYTVTINASDFGGSAGNNALASVNFSLVVKPTMTHTSPVNGLNTTTTTQAAVFIASYNDASLLCNLSVDGVVNVSSFSYNATPMQQNINGLLSEGIHTWNVTCWDNHNITNTSATWYFNVDTTAPTTAPNVTVIDSYLTGNMNISWLADSNAMLYGLFRSTTSLSDATTATRIANFSTLITKYIDNTTTHGITYWYFVTSIDYAGNENLSIVNRTAINAIANDTIMPRNPTHVDVSQSGNTVTIGWDGVLKDISGNSDYTGIQYKVWYLTTSSFNSSLNVTANSMTQIGSTVSTNTTTWTLTSSGNYTIAISAIDDGSNQNITMGANYGLNLMLNYTAPVDNTTTTTTTAAAAGGGGASAPPKSPDVIAKVSKMWATVPVGTETTMSVVNNDISAALIGVTPIATVTNVNIDVSSLTKPGSLILPPGFVYQYLEIKASGIVDAGIKNARVQFRIPLSWFNLNNVMRNTIKLYRYKDGWTKLETKELRVDGNYVIFEAATPGFSYFAIIGQKSSTPTSATSSTDGSTDGDEEQNAADLASSGSSNETNVQIGKPKKPFNWIPVIWSVVILSLVGSAVTVYFYNTRNEHEHLEAHKAMMQHHEATTSQNEIETEKTPSVEQPKPVHVAPNKRVPATKTVKKAVKKK